MQVLMEYPAEPVTASYVKACDLATRQWYWLDEDGPVVHWTDDHANLLSVLDRNMLRP